MQQETLLELERAEGGTRERGRHVRNGSPQRERAERLTVDSRALRSRLEQLRYARRRHATPRLRSSSTATSARTSLRCALPLPQGAGRASSPPVRSCATVLKREYAYAGTDDLDDAHRRAQCRDQHALRPSWRAAHKLSARRCRHLTAPRRSDTRTVLDPGAEEYDRRAVRRHRFEAASSTVVADCRRGGRFVTVEGAADARKRLAKKDTAFLSAATSVTSILTRHRRAHRA